MRLSLKPGNKMNPYGIAESVSAKISMAGKALYLFWYWVPLLSYCVFIFVLSSFSEPLRIPELYLPLFDSDKAIHGVEYVVLGFLLARSIFSLNPRFIPLFSAILTVALATLYGVSDEIHQMFVLGRNAEVWDVFADVLGSTLGTLCYVVAIRPHREAPSERSDHDKLL